MVFFIFWLRFFTKLEIPTLDGVQCKIMRVMNLYKVLLVGGLSVGLWSCATQQAMVPSAPVAASIPVAPSPAPQPQVAPQTIRPLPTRWVPTGPRPVVLVLAPQKDILWARALEELFLSPSFADKWYQVVGPSQWSPLLKNAVETKTRPVDLAAVGTQAKAKVTVVAEMIPSTAGTRMRVWMYGENGQSLGDVTLRQRTPVETGRELRNIMETTWKQVGVPLTSYSNGVWLLPSSYNNGVLLLPFAHQDRVQQLFETWTTAHPSDFYWYRVPSWVWATTGCATHARCLKEAFPAMLAVDAEPRGDQLMLLLKRTPFSMEADEKLLPVSGPYRHSVRLGEVLARLYPGGWQASIAASAPQGSFVNKDFWVWTQGPEPVDPWLTRLNVPLIPAPPAMVATAPEAPAGPTQPNTATSPVVVAWLDMARQRAVLPNSAKKLQLQFVDRVQRALMAQNKGSLVTVAMGSWKLPLKQTSEPMPVVLAVRYERKRLPTVSGGEKKAPVYELSLFLCDKNGRPVDRKQKKRIWEIPAEQLMIPGNKGIQPDVDLTPWLVQAKPWILL